jgi:hypothetical protein
MAITWKGRIPWEEILLQTGCVYPESLEPLLEALKQDLVEYHGFDPDKRNVSITKYSRYLAWMGVSETEFKLAKKTMKREAKRDPTLEEVMDIAFDGRQSMKVSPLKK